jgi:hypothetical protein
MQMKSKLWMYLSVIRLMVTKLHSRVWQPKVTTKKKITISCCEWLTRSSDLLQRPWLPRLPQARL